LQQTGDKWRNTTQAALLALGISVYNVFAPEPTDIGEDLIVDGQVREPSK
jgi:hypothetical protein